MPGVGPWAPLLLWLLQSASGKPRLAPPQNVTLFSRNFNMYLTWLPGPGNPEDVTYFVNYKSPPVFQQWRKVKNCTGTKELECSLMCEEKLDLFNKVKARVRASSPIGRSHWVESMSLEYLFDVEPAPPVLVVTRTKEFLSINATYQLPHCMPPSDLKYEVAFWKEGSENKTPFPITPHGQPVQIPLQPTTDESYCLSARTIYTYADSKYSQFSNSTCFSTEASGTNWAFLVLLLPVPLAIATRCVIQKSVRGNPWLQQTQKPQALDFSGHRHSVATFQPCGPERPDNLVLCSPKELTRRVRLAPRVRAPAPVQAGPDGSAQDEGEDEDEDDSGRVQPYLEPPPFLGQELQIPAGPGTPLAQVKESPAWDCSDRSWPSTGGSSSWDEAGSSGYTAKKGPGPELGGDKLSEDTGSQEESLKDDVPSWAHPDSFSLRLSLLPEELPISLKTLTFMDSSPEDEEEEEEEDGRESEAEDKGAGSWEAESLWGTEVRGRTLGHYVAR
ncbi:interferon lambda receptor 1 [Talpa occidentalis]|uniref:interferon lambda receptor 1 n=1 Tax=Talpa occidentalis TaxID=50954 RepID=UPI0023F94A87|nr:interferon lambda receptor 1 [Talpa occidentalis]